MVVFDPTMARRVWLDSRMVMVSVVVSVAAAEDPTLPMAGVVAVCRRNSSSSSSNPSVVVVVAWASEAKVVSIPSTTLLRAVHPCKVEGWAAGR